MNYQQLKKYQRENRENFSEALGLRAHRALSWLKRAELEGEDYDSKYIFLWIAFNAAYANEFDERDSFSEQRKFMEFFAKLIKLDQKNLLYHGVWDNFTGSIRILLENPYIFGSFWAYQNAMIDKETWERQFSQSQSSAQRALSKMDTRRVLAEVFSRLYVLRNQLMHGGATWQSSVNRAQIRDGARILSFVVPTVIHLMMLNPSELWGEPVYPVVN